MSSVQIKQLLFETGSCKRSIIFMSDENVHLKARLAELLKEGIESQMLDDLELFQNRFVKLDTVIALVRNDVVELERMLAKEKFDGDQVFLNETSTRLKRLRNSLTTIEKQFLSARTEFNLSAAAFRYLS